MKKFFALIVVVGCFALAFTGVAIAEEPDGEGVEVEEDETVSEMEFISSVSPRNVLHIVDYNVNSAGKFNVTLYSETSQRIVVTEMMMGDGVQQLSQQEHHIPEGKIEVTMFVDNSHSTMGLTIANAHGITGVKDSTGGFSFDESYSGNQMLFFGMFGFVGGTFVVAIGAYRRQIKMNGKVEEIL